jgi:hypothetical protein
MMQTPLNLLVLIRQDSENHALPSKYQESSVLEDGFEGIANLARHGLHAVPDWLAALLFSHVRSDEAKESASNRPPKWTADDSYDV